MRLIRSEASLPVRILRDTVLILFIVIFVSIVYNFRNRDSSTEVALMAEATQSKEVKGIFVRDEEVVTYSGSGVLSYCVADGGKLGSGTVIAEVYSSDSQIALNRQIEALEKRLALLKKIQNPGTLESAQPTSLSESIRDGYRSLIACRDRRDYSSIASEAEGLVVQLSTYQIVTDEVSDFNSQIAEIEAELAKLRMSSAQPVEVKKSPRSAYFVSYSDGYEKVLTCASLPDLTAEQINSVKDSRQESSTVVGKLIDGYGWYFAGIVDNSGLEYSVGEEVRLRFESSAETFDAEITEIRDDGDQKQSIIVLWCSQFNYDLVQHRAATVEIIKGDYSGLRVPREAIRFAEIQTGSPGEAGGVTTVTQKGVYVQKGEQVEFKKIDVIYEGGDYVLSAVHDADPGYLALYDDIMIEGAD
ncbi:MAG: hypothetical protein IJM44_02390 [Ruminococcus sp.]|nr:hypothetical protein [Ruminococcus sp.]